MNQFKYRWILYFISGVILTTLFIQVYWNYKNYELGKQQLVNDVQTSLDNTVDQYYAQLATGESFKFIKDSIEVDCSPVVNILVQGHGSPMTKQRGEAMTTGKLSLERLAGSPWIRITIIDRAGKRAWSNPIWIDG